MTSDSPKLSQILAPHFYELYKKIKQEDVTEAWLRGGRGSTKSSFISIVIVLGIMRFKDTHGVCFRRFENEIRDSVFAQLQWAINILGVDHLWTERTSPFKLIYNPTGQVILFKGADNPKKVKSTKIPKGYVKYVWFEEVDQFNGMEEIRNLKQSLIRGTDEHQLLLLSYNPPKSARNWANAETKIAKKGRIVHYSDYRTVPPQWLGKQFLDDAEHLKAVNESAYNHEYLGIETGTGLEVFNNVTLREITDKEISQFVNHEQGLDFGYTDDPLCFEQAEFIAKKKQLLLFSEISGRKMKNSTFAAKLTEEQRDNVMMADAAEPKSIAELREDYGLNIHAAKKAPGSVEHGIKYLQDLEEIVIDPARCPLAAKEFINYALDVDKYGEPISKYPDKDNHSIDAVRYMMDRHILLYRKERRKRKVGKPIRIPVANPWGGRR